MRLNLAVIVMLGLPAMAAAQPAAPVAGGVVPLPPIGLPLPQIGLPLPATGLPAIAAPQTRRPANRPAPHPRRPHRSGPYAVPVYSLAVSLRSAGRDHLTPTRHRIPALRRSRAWGTCNLTSRRGGEQQLYVDGYYMGTLVDFDSGVELEAGPHAVEIRAPGFEPLGFSVNIGPGRTITYRGTLESDRRDAGASTARRKLAANRRSHTDDWLHRSGMLYRERAARGCGIARQLRSEPRDYDQALSVS